MRSNWKALFAVLWGVLVGSLAGCYAGQAHQDYANAQDPKFAKPASGIYSMESRQYHIAFKADGKICIAPADASVQGRASEEECGDWNDPRGMYLAITEFDNTSDLGLWTRYMYTFSPYSVVPNAFVGTVEEARYSTRGKLSEEHGEARMVLIKADP